MTVDLKIKGHKSLYLQNYFNDKTVAGSLAMTSLLIEKV